MHRSKIEWVLNPDNKTLGWIWNPLSGCRNHVNGLCKGGGFPCYAYGLANGRLKQRYLANHNLARSGYPIPTDLNELPSDEDDPFYPRFWPNRLEEHRVHSTDLGKGIFVCDMSDLFGVGIPEEWTRKVIEYITTEFDDRFYLLTKQPQNLAKWSPFPDNCWVGVTATNSYMFSNAMFYLRQIEASVKYLSLEPLMERILPKFIGGIEGINWIIIGAMTCSGGDLAKASSQFPELTAKPFGNRYVMLPKLEWVQEIVEAADKAEIPVFLKDNLSDLIPVNSTLRYGPAGELRLRQEMPK